MNPYAYISLEDYVHCQVNTSAMYEQIRPYVTKKFDAKWDLGLTNEEHHSRKMISSSQIKHLAHCDLSYFKSLYIDRAEKKASTPAQQEAFSFGTCAHMAILEPNEFEKRVFICETNRRTKQFKDFCRNVFGTEDLKKGKGGGFLVGDMKDEIFLVTREQYNIFKKYEEGVKSHAHLNDCFYKYDNQREVSGSACCPLTGLELMIRTDIQGRYPDGYGYILDPKTAAFEGVSEIQASLANFNYDLQQAFYLYVANLIAKQEQAAPFIDFGFIFFQKNSPYGLCHVRLQSIDNALQTLTDLLVRVAYCKYVGRYPTYDNSSVLLLDMPKFVSYKRAEQREALDSSLDFNFDKY